MYNEMFKDLNEQLQAGLKPWLQLNTAVLEQVESLTNAQLDSAKFYADLSIAQLKQLTAVQSPAELSQLGAKQVELAKEVQSRVKADAEKLVDINKNLKEACESVTKAAV
ncbi:phasin family protein [Thalassotalea maritima]|uniref:phasin family protein n=1 Tax=Thalassotalea maritima TaxID=3242416 RepID=UPI0035299283